LTPAPSHTLPQAKPSIANRRNIKPRRRGTYDNEIHALAERPRHSLPTGDSQETPFPPIKPTDLPADIVLARLSALRSRIRGKGPSWMASCPAHRDSTPSLSLTETAEGALLLHCWGGCKTEAVLSKLELDFSDLYPSCYALQYGTRRPGGTLRLRSTESYSEVVEPTHEECADWKRRLKEYRAPTHALNRLSVHLGLPYLALLALRVGYCPDDERNPCWVFPERDDRGRLVGLVRRYPDGVKLALTGSKRGLTIPHYGKELPSGPLYLVEGASDTAALVSVGAFAIGRANAYGTAAERLWLTRLLGRHADRDIIVVGDRDKGGVGQWGAAKLAAYLHENLQRSVGWALPCKPYKDSRDQVVAGRWAKGLCVQEVLK